MSNSTNNMSEKLVQYLDGELTGAEGSAVALQLQSDNLLAEEYRSLLAAREAVRLYGLQQQVAGVHKQMMEQLQTPVKKINSVSRIARYSIAVAAGVILIIAGIWGYNFYTLSSHKVFASNYQVYEPGKFRDSNSKLSAIQQAYENKEYQKVTDLGTTNGNSATTAEEDLLTALSFVELKQDTRAIEKFKETIVKSAASGTGQVKDAAEYYLSLTYIRNGDYDFALEQLRKIRDDKQHTYHSRATAKLIRQVKLLKWR